MQPHTHYDAFLALAGASFLTIVGALSVSSYDCGIITGIAILSADIPLLIGFARWDPPDFVWESPLRHHVSNILWVVSMPAALVGISFVLAHVHILCALLFAGFSILATLLYFWRLRELDAARPHPPSQPSKPVTNEKTD